MVSANKDFKHSKQIMDPCTQCIDHGCSLDSGTITKQGDAKDMAILEEQVSLLDLIDVIQLCQKSSPHLVAPRWCVGWG